MSGWTPNNIQLKEPMDRYSTFAGNSVLPPPLKIVRGRWRNRAQQARISIARAAAKGARRLRNLRRWRKYRLRRRNMYRKHRAVSRWYANGRSIQSIPTSGRRYIRKYSKRMYRRWKYSPPKKTIRWTLNSTNAKAIQCSVTTSNRQNVGVWYCNNSGGSTTAISMPNIPRTLVSISDSTTPTAYQEYWARIFKIYGEFRIALEQDPNWNYPILVRILLVKQNSPTNQSLMESLPQVLFNTTAVNSGYKLNWKARMRYTYNCGIYADKLLRLTEENKYTAIYKFKVPVYMANTPSTADNGWAWSSQYNTLSVIVYIGVPNYVIPNATTAETTSISGQYSLNLSCFPQFRMMPNFAGQNNALPVSNSILTTTSTGSSTVADLQETGSSTEPVNESS